jgi:hypothetical protein
MRTSPLPSGCRKFRSYSELAKHIGLTVVEATGKVISGVLRLRGSAHDGMIFADADLNPFTRKFAPSPALAGKFAGKFSRRMSLTHPHRLF